MKPLSRISSLAVLSLALGSCQTGDGAPTQPQPDDRVGLSARVVAISVLPVANHVRFRLGVNSDTGAWHDSAYQKGRVLQVGRVPKGSAIVLDLRAYSLRSPRDTVWKWFARTEDTAHSALSIQLAANPIPTASDLLVAVNPSGAVALPLGSRYSLDANERAPLTSIVSASPIVVPAGGVLRAQIRFVVPGTKDTLSGDSLRFEGAPLVPPAMPNFSYKKGIDLPSEIAVGDTILIQAAENSRLAYTLDSSAPRCEQAILTREYSVPVASDMAGKTLMLRAISCRDNSASAMKEKLVLVAKLGTAPRPVIGIPNGFDSASTTQSAIPWKQAVQLVVPSGSKVTWKLLVLPASRTIDGSSWSGLGLPGAGDSTTSRIAIDTSLLVNLPKSDSVATVLVVATMSDSLGVPQDTAKLRWTISIPYVPPVVEAPKAPKMSVGGATLTEEHQVGQSVLVEADSGTRLAFTTNGEEPKCADASLRGDTTWVIDATRSGSTVQLKAISCRGSLGSALASRAVKITLVGEVKKPQLEIPSQFDSANATASLPWTGDVELNLPAKTTLAWNLRVVPKAPLGSDWTALGVPTSTSKTGSGDLLQLKASLLETLGPTDSVAMVIASAVLLDSTGLPLDTARLRWTITVPVVPKPLLKSTKEATRLLISWPVTSATQGAIAWYLVGNSPDTNKVLAVGSANGRDSFFVSLEAGSLARVSVVSIDAATGRRSPVATVVDSTPLPPNQPGFQLANTSTLEGTVRIVLSAATLADPRTTWSVGIVQGSSSSEIQYNRGMIDTSGTWMTTLSAGTWTVGVRATRDGLVRDSIATLVVQRTKGLKPGSVRGLAVRSKDSSSIVWTWSKVASRSYRIYLLREKDFLAPADTVDCLASDKQDIGNVDSFKVSGLSSGATVSFAIVALAGTDSASGDADPALGESITTLVPPPDPMLTVQNSNPATGEVTILVSNFDGFGTWNLGVDSTGGNAFSWSLLTAKTTVLRFARNGTMAFRVEASRDGYVKLANRTLGIKNTNLVAPAAPSGLRWTRGQTSLVLRWTSLPGHRYRLFYDNSNYSSDLDTTSSTKLNKDLDSSHTFNTTAGQPVRVALQVVSAPDSTKPSRLMFTRETSLATIDAVVSISGSFNPTTRTVSFSWPSVAGAVKYGYTSSLEAGTKESTGPAVSLTYSPTTRDVSISVWAINADGVASTKRDFSLHIPGNVGSTNLQAWDVRTNGTTLLIAGKSSENIPGEAPDSVIVRLRRGSNVIQTWNLPYSNLATFATQLVLDSASLNAKQYLVQAQFRWTSGITTKGDTTSIDSRNVVGFVGKVPVAVSDVAAGKTVLTVENFGEIYPAPSGWTAAVQAEVDGQWIDILENDQVDVYPSLRTSNGSGAYPLGVKKIQVFYHSGQDTSVVRTVDVGYSEHLMHEGKDYPIVTFGTRRWISRPMNTPTDSGYCADGQISADCGSTGRLYPWLEATGRTEFPASGDNPSRGVCPEGWRLPFSSETAILLNEIGPGWSWDTRTAYDMVDLMARARFELQGNSREGYWSSGHYFVDYPAMWTSTTGTSIPSWTDLYFMANSGDHMFVSAISRNTTFAQHALVFCVDDPD